MQESLVPAFALENQLAGKEQTLPKLHRFDVTKLAESITPIETNRNSGSGACARGASPRAHALFKRLQFGDQTYRATVCSTGAKLMRCNSVIPVPSIVPSTSS